MGQASRGEAGALGRGEVAPEKVALTISAVDERSLCLGRDLLQSRQQSSVFITGVGVSFEFTPLNMARR